ncbi:hypothetical protein [Adhaeribacter aquaticus]|uniref:hypothetical protein n=1 Tax=Adhaeribacter aquaticus TaxID=299567 RepID=UPI0003FC9E80|nr:hypothetical protein [Adhaeribacter aquaticus]
MQAKVKEWLKRYLPAELLSIISTLTAAWLAHHITQNGLTTALAGTWGGNLGYFGYILVADVLATKRMLYEQGRLYSTKTLLKNLRALVLEFGLAEVADSFFIRPFLMFFLPIYFENLTWGVLLAKFIADITFYIPAIISYELSKNKFRKFDS